MTRRRPVDMRKSLTVGILRESRPDEFRAPLSPTDVLWLKRRKIDIEVESSSIRAFTDAEYKAAGARIVDKFRNASLLLGIKEPEAWRLYRNTVYMVFSHTIKGNPKNLPIIKESINRGVTLIDYEKITDSAGNRLCYFGRMAGICGAVDSLYYLGKKLRYKGIRNPFASIGPASSYSSFAELKSAMSRLSGIIRKNGFDRRISPFIIGITGHGHVSQGAGEILKLLNPIEIHPRDIKRFVRHQRKVHKKIYKIVFLREEKFRSKDKKGFYFEDYLAHPKRFESNLDRYLADLNILINGSYWDKRFPRLVTKDMIRRLYRRRFRLEFIGDISCDINGSVELTYKATNFFNPVYTYNPKRGEYTDGYRADGITILSRDNLPAELPQDASRDFGLLVRDYVYQIAAHGVKDITNHAAIPAEVRRAVMVQQKRLTPLYRHLRKNLRGKNI